MFVDDDNKMKLLKMKEKLLEVSPDDREKNLQDYKNIVIDIDKDVYLTYVDKIKNTNYHKLPYPEQLEVLLELEQEYNDINEMQYGFRNVYNKYTNDELELSDLSNILIDNIRIRISNIQGYLINSRRLVSDKDTVEKMNLQLITFEKKRNAAQERFLSMEKDLRYDFINAEGRLVVNGESKYASTVNEYNAEGIDLKKILDDDQELEKVLTTVNTECSNNDEKLQVAKICYDNMPTEENKEVYNSINRDMLLSRYKLTLLQIANLINKDYDTYDEMIQKRKQYKALNALRIECLNKLNIEFMIDPFMRTKVDEQIESIMGYEGLTENILMLRRRIANLTTVVENRISSNTDFIIDLNTRINFVKDTTSFDKIVDDKDIIVDMDNRNEEEKVAKVEEPVIPKKILRNQVVKVAFPKKDFAINRVKEKSSNVLKRIYGLFFGNKEEKIKTESPKLVIQESMPEYDVDYERINKHEEVVNENKTDFINDDNTYISSVIVDNSSDIVTDSDEVINTDDTLPVENNVETNDDNIFEEIKPFEETPLFNDRFDEDLFTNEIKENKSIFEEDNNKQDSENLMKLPIDLGKNETIEKEEKKNDMPDMFWVTQEDDNIENNEPTFDEQIDKLMNEEQIESSSRRKR